MRETVQTIIDVLVLYGLLYIFSAALDRPIEKGALAAGLGLLALIRVNRLIANAPRKEEVGE